MTARQEVLTELREAIRRLERRPARAAGVLACGLPEVDAVLPGGGFPRGALAELAGGPASGKTAVALGLVAGLADGELAAFVDGRGELYPPAAVALGVDLGRLVIVRPGAAPGAGGGGRRPAGDGRTPGLAALWAAEALLGSGAFAVVVLDVPVAGQRGLDLALQRLRAAAERGGAAGLWLAGPGGVRIPGALRVELARDGGRIAARRCVGGVAVPAGAGPEEARDRRLHPLLRLHPVAGQSPAPPPPGGEEGADVA